MPTTTQASVGYNYLAGRGYNAVNTLLLPLTTVELIAVIRAVVAPVTHQAVGDTLATVTQELVRWAGWLLCHWKIFK